MVVVWVVVVVAAPLASPLACYSCYSRDRCWSRG